jgi:hypothetical protein
LLLDRRWRRVAFGLDGGEQGGMEFQLVEGALHGFGLGSILVGFSRLGHVVLILKKQQQLARKTGWTGCAKAGLRVLRTPVRVRARCI